MNNVVKITFLAFLVLLLIITSSILIGTFYSMPSGNVALIKMHQSIVSMNDVMSSSQTSDELIKLLKQAEENPNVEAIVLSINSGGGMVVASKEVANQVLNSSKPVIAWIREVGASGAYLIASASDYIISDELSMIGSIGSTMTYLEVSELLNDYGVEYNRLVSGDYKDMGSIYKNLTEEEEEIFMNLINQSFNYFLNFVIEHRELTNTSVEEISTGRIISGSEGYELGLVDEIGSEEEVKNYLKTLNLTSVKFQEYEASSLSLPLSLLSDYEISQTIPLYN